MTNITTVHRAYDPPPRPYKEHATPSLDRPRWEFIEYLGGGIGTDSPGGHSRRQGFRRIRDI